MDDVIDGLSDQILNLAVIIGRPIRGIHIGHQMNEKMGNLVDEFQRFGVLEDDFFFVTLTILPLISLFVVLPAVDFEFRILHVLAQLDEKFSLIFEELEKFEVVGLSFQECGVGCCLLSLVDLLDERINGFTCLDGHIFILVEEICVELIEEGYVVLGGDEISLEYFQH